MSAVALAAFFFAPSAGVAADAPGRMRDGVWAQTYSDIAPDPQIRFGVLANGMRYAIMHNATPPGQVSLRLRIGAGALEEAEDQRGLAHLLEHMAFRGSTHVPQDEMARILERKGLAFGPDTNAFTAMDQTVFKLDLPGADADRVDTGLILLREIAGELTLAPGAMEVERGVVLSEERAADSPFDRMSKAGQAFEFEDQLAARRDPMGLTDVVKGAPATRVRAYYEAFYRPENTTLIAVGDFDVGAMQAKIEARFGDWRGKGPEGAAPQLGQPKTRALTVRTFVADGLPLIATLSWARPFDEEADTFARERRYLAQSLVFQILNTRLANLAQGANPPFLIANAGRQNADRSAQIASVTVLPAAAGGIAPAVTAAVVALRRLAQFGITQSELNDALANQRNGVAAAAASASTRNTVAVADGLVSITNENLVSTSPAQYLANFEAEAAGLTLASINAGLKDYFTGAGPLILVASPKPVPGGEAGIGEIYAKAARQAIEPSVTAAAKPWPYDRFGAPGKVLWRREIADLGLTQVRFANGVRLNVKATAFAKDEILVTVRIGHGLLGASAEQARVAWLAGALPAGGTRELTADEIRQSLTGVIAGVGFTMGEDAFVASGVTRPQDFSKELELVTATLSRPAYRAEAIERMKSVLMAIRPTMESSPYGIMALNLDVLLHGGDPRWPHAPTVDEIAAARPGDLRALLEPALNSGAMEITIVGDVTVERAIAEVGATLGTLPQRDEPESVPAAARTIHAPAGAGPPTVLLHRGRGDQALAYAEWPTTDYYADPREARIIGLTAQVLQNRLVDRIRITQGATYSPSASYIASTDLIGYGLISAAVEIPPQRIDGFYKDLADIVTDMGRAPPSADELERAKAPLVNQATKARQSNFFWLGQLANSQAEPRALDTIRDELAEDAAIGADDIMRVSRKYLAADRAWKLIVRNADAGLDRARQTRLSTSSSSSAAPHWSARPGSRLRSSSGRSATGAGSARRSRAW